MFQTLATHVHLFDGLAFEESSQQRHAHVGGRLCAIIVGKAHAFLLQQLASTPRCTFSNSMTPHEQAADSVYDPDVFAHCVAAAGFEPVALALLYAGADQPPS